MSLSAKRILERLEIELFHHGGKPEENGKLPCTYEHFEEYGVHADAIAPAIREAVALGFVEITRPGCAGNAGYRQPTLYRLTYRHSGSHRETTDEWRQIKTIEEAKAIAERARGTPSDRRPKTKLHPRRKPGAAPPPETRGGNDHFPPPETMGTVPPPETRGTSISRVGTRLGEGGPEARPWKHGPRPCRRRVASCSPVSNPAHDRGPAHDLRRPAEHHHCDKRRSRRSRGAAR